MNKYTILALGALAVTGLAACSDDENYDNPSGETYIYTISVANGGMSGAEIIAGDVNEDAKTVEFTIPAETDIQAIKFSAKLSLGAKFDQDTYDFYSSESSVLEKDIEIVNVENRSTYHVTINLLDPTETPAMTGITVLNDDGDECTGFVSTGNMTLYLNAPSSTKATVVSTSTLPRRASVTFTNASDGVISADDPGKVVVEFGGRSITLDIDFGGSPVFGANWATTTAYAYTSGEGTLWSDFSAENCRSAAFDGEYLLLPSREGGTSPKVISASSILAGAPSAVDLDVSAISSDATHEVSACEIAYGHYYMCSLSTAVPEPGMNIYHWNGKDAVCELIGVFVGNDEVKGRWGDNMSIDLDENGNGYLWFFDHATGATAIRLAVTNWTTINLEPEVLETPYSLAYYAKLNRVSGEDGVYTLTSTYQRTILLVDRDLNVLNRIDAQDGCDYPVISETDARIFNYNGERYMITTSSWGWHYKNAQTLRVYDLSDGGSTSIAITNFNQTARIPVFSYELPGANCSAFSAATGWAQAEDGSLLIMGAAPRGGFVVVKAEKKRSE